MTDTTTDEAAIIAAETARTKSLIDADKAAMADLLAPEFTYTHSSGRTDTRQSYLAAFGTRHVFRSAGHADLSVRHYGDVAILAGDLDVVLAPVTGGEARTSRLRFIAVWVRSGAGWRLAAFQNTTRAA